MTAKIIYWMGVVSIIGMGIGILAALGWFIITTIPFFLAILAVFAGIIALGLLMGWAETVIEQDKKYKIRA